MSTTYYKYKDGSYTPLLSEALKHVNGTKALELGAGKMSDAILLATHGFKVIAIDKEPIALTYAKNAEDITAINSTFEDFSYPENEFDIVNSQWSLPFIHPEKFKGTFTKIISSIKRGGILCVNFYGKHDDWYGSKKDMTFFSKEEIEELLQNFRIIHFEEKEEDIKNLHNEDIKHWHVFDVIAKKQ